MDFSINLHCGPVNESIHSFWIGDFSLQAACRRKKSGPATMARPAFETVGV